LLTEPAAAFTTYQTGNSPLEVAFANASQYVYPDSIDGGHYVWDFGDGSPPFACGQGFGACPDVVLHSYAAQGQYTASLRAVVCSDTSQVEQSVVVVWNGIPIVEGDTWANVHPNPAQNTAFVPYHIAADKTANLCLYDIYGKLVYTTTLQNSGIAELPTAQQATGIYVLQVTMNGSSIAQQKIVLLK
jgi:PKD repeat protein